MLILLLGTDTWPESSSSNLSRFIVLVSERGERVRECVSACVCVCVCACVRVVERVWGSEYDKDTFVVDAVAEKICLFVLNFNIAEK